MEVKWKLKKIHNEQVLVLSEYKNGNQEIRWYPIALVHIDEFYPGQFNGNHELFDQLNEKEEVNVTAKFIIEEE